jgi:exopolysaccharide/PEP-CTERM locus tyrosine autokinase
MTSSIEKAIEKMQQTSAGVADGQGKNDVDPALGIGEHRGKDSAGNNTRTRSNTQRFEELDLGRLRTAGMVTPDLPATSIAEEYRIIKRPLLNNAFGPHAQLNDSKNLIMVTSAFAGEGKTYTSVNLAMSMAMEKDKTVLLVDADVSKADVSKYLGTAPGIGLSDYLMDDSLRLDEILIKTNVPKLTLLSAGNHFSNITELLASDSMKRLTLDLAQRYPDRVIIFDSPPLIPTSEARVLANLMGQILVVVEADVTPQSGVLEAVGFIDKNKTIGFVLNKSKQSRSSKYGYGYGYNTRS